MYFTLLYNHLINHYIHCTIYLPCHFDFPRLNHLFGSLTPSLFTLLYTLLSIQCVLVPLI
nr:MAG TPA: hypothetical protein [Caudoviricetes sp.]